MLIHGNKRGGARDLALHLLKEENDHVEVHELRGFMSDDLVSALKEVHVISKGTQAKKFLFSVGFNPPEDKQISTQTFKQAIKQVENEFGLERQPRAIVFHEKKGRRHCHVAWSLIDTQKMKAIKLDYSKRRMMGISRSLFLEHGWEMPAGMIDQRNRNPKNFTLAQWQQAKRIDKDPRQIKQDLQDSWALSDDQASFEAALNERGYTLAKGDRAAFVVLDRKCEMFALGKKWLGVSVKDIRKKLGGEKKLPSIEHTRRKIADGMTDHIKSLQEQQTSAVQARVALLNDQLKRMINSQRRERAMLKAAQDKRWQTETQTRQTRFNKGLKGLLDFVTGKRSKIKQQNQRETKAAYRRDEQEKDTFVFMHLEQRRGLQYRIGRLQNFERKSDKLLDNDLSQYHEINQGRRDMFERAQSKDRNKDHGPSRGR
ncbi:MAG: hypothetical protein ACI9SP_000753 [Arenicella sp.]|jgi:hypothetical protein